jgi:hypothetical protein
MDMPVSGVQAMHAYDCHISGAITEGGRATHKVHLRAPMADFTAGLSKTCSHYMTATYTPSLAEHND